MGDAGAVGVLAAIGWDVSRANGQSRPYGFVARARDPSELDDGQHPLSALWACWRDRGHTFDHAEEDALLEGRFAGKYCVIARKPDTSSLVFSQIGRGIVIYRESWKNNAHGLRIEDQPDVRYAKSVAQQWRRAFVDHVPTLFDVDAIVHQPPHRENWRTQYTRLTLPVVSPTGESSMLSATYMDPRVDLRIEID